MFGFISLPSLGPMELVFMVSLFGLVIWKSNLVARKPK